MKAFGYDEGDYISCEISGLPANDVHHIEARGNGGDPKGEKDRIENLMAITRQHHVHYGDKPYYMARLFKWHKNRMIDHGVKFDEKYINDKIKHYESINDTSNDLAVVHS